MGDSVGTSVSGGGLASRSSSGKKRYDFSNSLYRPYRPMSTPRVPHDPVALEILQAKKQQQINKERYVAVQNRIRNLKAIEEKTQKKVERQKQTEEFLSLVRERRQMEERFKERIKSERQALELESRIYHLRSKQQCSKMISTARSRVLSEKRETVDQLKRTSEKIDAEIERHRELEHMFNVDRRRAIESEMKRVREQRALSANGHREMLKSQYRSKLDIEKQKADEATQMLQELEKQAEAVEGRRSQAN